MKLNDLIITDTTGDIYYEKNGNTIKIGEFNFDYKYNHMTIDLGSICKIEYEFRTDEMRKNCVGMTPHMYWFKSQFVCDRYHGTYSHDYKWVHDLFDAVTPFTEEINERIKSLITVSINRIWRTGLGIYHEGESIE